MNRDPSIWESKTTWRTTVETKDPDGRIETWVLDMNPFVALARAVKEHAQKYNIDEEGILCREKEAHLL